MSAFALAILYAFAIYLIGLGLVASSDPRRAIRFLGLFAQTRRANALEAGLRLIVGLAFLRLADDLPGRWIPLTFGGVLIVSAIAMLALPDAHRRFADKVVPQASRFIFLIAFVSLVFGLSLMIVLVPLSAIILSLH
jgi:hypothetical protein